MEAVDDRVKGLELGADDYLVKPFAFVELLARVRVLASARRAHAGAAADRRSGARLHPAPRNSRTAKPLNLRRKSSASSNT